MRTKTYIRLAVLTWTTLFSLQNAVAQSGTTGYEYLNIPVSAHSAALGSYNISIVKTMPR